MPGSTLIKIPGGWCPLVNLQPGDIVIGPQGNEAKVKAVHPQGKTDIYRFLFEDGRYADSHPLHLWKVTESPLWGELNGDIETHITTSEDIANHFSQFRYHIPLVEVIEGNAPQPFTAHEMVNRLLYSTESLATTITELPYRSRFDLIKGLMETLAELTLTESGFTLHFPGRAGIKPFCELLWSIGGIARCEDQTVSVCHPNLLRLLDDASREIYLQQFRKPLPILGLRIEGIEKCKPQETYCISIESEDKLYVTTNYIVTHNSLEY